ncbi:DUF3309 family protein [Rhodopseudomonas sp. HC1]|uniref:DUF3309 family protein n=1 Tax=Rhodopseudomonas infernalis TaxID=2897386 RepID=UPI001EE971FD|nr:DUF3309 family protein [Rhodopseudomonas infernalis]MCG6205009.1 DUF3309 family protein [Rhodopseudomonas infernalis]
MSFATILIIALTILLLGGFSQRFGGYGYGRGSGLTGLIGVILMVVILMVLLRKL